MMATGSSAETISVFLCYLRLLLAVMEPFVPGLAEKGRKLLQLPNLDKLSYFESSSPDLFAKKLLALHIDNTILVKPTLLVKESTNTST